MRILSVVSLIVLAAAALAACTTPAHAGGPLPCHGIEGATGGAITPMAYMANPEPKCATFKKPVVAMSYVNLNDKSLVALSITEMVGDRIEIGYAADRLGLGKLARRHPRRDPPSTLTEPTSGCTTSMCGTCWSRKARALPA